MSKLERGFLVFVLGALAVVILPLAANAQLRNQNRYSKKTVSDLIKRLENSSDRFRRDFDNALDRSNINNTQLEREYQGYVDNYEQSLDRLRSNFDRNRNWWEVRNDVQDVVSRATPVNDIIIKLPFQRNIEKQWRQMRNDLNKVADTYDLPGLNGGGWNGGYPGYPGNPGNPGYPGNDGGGWDNTWSMSRPPSWAVGTYYGIGPRGERITLAIQANGRATSSIDNSPINFGRYYRGLLTFGNESARLVRTRNGIQTVSTNKRETINYSKQGWAGNDDRWENDNSARPVSWAVGTYYARSPRDGSRITMSIDRNGRVVVTFGNGAPSYGTLNGDRLSMGGATSRLYREGNGFRTVQDSNGETIRYSSY